jgi:hypothetical protein
MFEKNDKRRLYQLMDMYLAETISASVFCDEFYYSYDLELDETVLTDLESQVFSDLGTFAGRFSPYEENYKLDPKAFFTEEQLREKVLEKKKLKEQSPI